MTTALEERTALAVPKTAEPSEAARPRRGWIGDWLRLVAVVGLALASELLYVGVWPLSYYLTQATDFTHLYLLQYPWVWDRIAILFIQLESFLPDAARSLPTLVDALIAVFIVSFLFYLLALLFAHCGLPRGWGLGAVVGAALAFHATLFLMPGLFTTDLFSYIIYGDIAAVYQQNPWTQLPSYFPQNRVVGWIHPIWHDAPSIYGPAWIDFTLPLAWEVAGASDVDKVLAYKLLDNIGHFASVALLALAVHRLRPGTVTASVMLYAWNPLVVFEFGGNGHNDAVMIAGMMLGVALFAWRQPALGLVALTVSFLLKMASILLVPYYVVAWAREQRRAWQFLGVFCLAAVIQVASVVALYAPWWQGVETIGPILNWSSGPMFNNYVPDILARELAKEYLFNPDNPDPVGSLEDSRWWVKLVARIIFAGYCVWELFQARGCGGMAASGARVMLGFLLIVNTWVLPWYFTWPLALAAVGGWGSLTAKVLVGFSLSAPTVMYYHHFWHPYMADSTYLLYLAPLLIAPIGWAERLWAHKAT